jgi:hypothetical protein
MVLEKAPALGIIEEDVHHCSVHVSNLTAICPKFHAAQQRHTSVPRILEGQIKVPATASVVGRWRDEEDTVHPTSIVFLAKGLAVHELLPHIIPLANFQTTENLQHFGPILLQASCVMIGEHQPSENPIDLMRLQLIMQPI